MNGSDGQRETYYVFVACPGDCVEEKRFVQEFFRDWNKSTGAILCVSIDVLDWELDTHSGVGRGQELILKQTVELHKERLLLIVVILAQHFGSPTGKFDSGTEEEFEWAMRQHRDSGFPEIMLFFRRANKFIVESDQPVEINRALRQYRKVHAFRERVKSSVYYREYEATVADRSFERTFPRNVNHWMAKNDLLWSSVGQRSVRGDRAAMLHGPTMRMNPRENGVAEWTGARMEPINTNIIGPNWWVC